MNLTISSASIGLPKKSYNNEEIAAKYSLETTDEWITTRTGIKSRYLCDKNEDLLSMSIEACRSLKIDKNKIGALIVATSTNRHYYPSVATYLHQALELPTNISVFDISDACNAFIQATQVAHSLIKHTGKSAIIVGVDQMSRFVDWSDRSTCILFGDGAGAIILEDRPNKKYAETNYTLSSYTDLFNITPKFGMEGRQVFKMAVESMTADVKNILHKAKLQAKDVQHFAPHQANERITKAVGENLGIVGISNIEENGNTSAATIPMALYKVVQDFQPGDFLLMTAFGAGLRGGSILLEL